MRKFMNTILLVGFLGTISISWSDAAIAAQTSSINESNRLVDAREKPIEVAPSSPLEIPFSLVVIPKKAKLKISFLVDSKGRCPKTYEPTTISINKKRVEEIDFLRN